MTHISKRLEKFDSSEFRQVFIRQQNIHDPIDLSVGVPEDFTPAHIKQAGIDAILNDKTTYLPANGLEDLRLEIAKKMLIENKINVTGSQVSVVPGLTTGLMVVYLALLDPGDEVIVFDPYYPPYKHLARSLGAEVISLPILPDYLPDIPLLESAITSKTKLIILNTPNNPTGAVYPENTIRKIVEIASEHGIVIISDEIYENFVYGVDHFSPGSIYANTITMNGFSKEHSMTGWRLGYVAGPQNIIDAINEIQQYMVFSSSSIAQHAAVAALKHIRQIRSKYKIKRDFVVAELTKMGYEIYGAEGAYYVFLRTPNEMDDLEFVERAAEHSLLLIPGRAFSDMHGYFRLSFGADISVLRKGMKALSVLTEEIKGE